MARPLTAETRRSVIAEERMVFVRAEQCSCHEGTRARYLFYVGLNWLNWLNWLNLGWCGAIDDDDDDDAWRAREEASKK